MTCDELVGMVDRGGLAAQPPGTVYAHLANCPTCASLIASRSPETALSPTLPADPDSLARASSPGVPRTIGRYQVQLVLGAGGMGIVYAAWDPELRRRVALKLVRPERAVGQSRQQLLREARALARISHPNVVTAHDVGEHDGEIFVATELVAGETLATWHSGRSPGEIVAAWIQAARGLAAAHAEGVVHRDVKPSNVLVGADGRVRIGDFGLAVEGGAGESGAPVRALGSGGGNPTVPASAPDATIGHVVVTATGFFGGTPGYMAPEHEQGRAADARSDQFSLCVSIAETLTGQRPRANGRVDVQPPALAAALERGLSAEPLARFPSVAALADALAAAVAPRRRRWPLVIAAVAAAGVLTVGTAVASMAVGARDAPCEVVQVPPDLWPASRRASIERQVAPGVAAHIDGWLASWSSAAAGVCTPGRSTPAIQPRQRECLAGLLADLRGVLDSWAVTMPDPMQAFSQLETIGLPSRCSPVAVAESGEPPRDKKAEVGEIRRALAALSPKDVSPAARARVSGLVARARQVGYAPLVVQALRSQAWVESSTDQAAAIRSLREAVAAAGPDRYGRVLASIQLLELLGPDRVSEAATLAEATRSEIARLGGDPALEAELDYQLGGIWKARGDHDQSIAAFDRARRGFRTAFGAGDLYEAVALHSLAGLYIASDVASAKGKALQDEAEAMFQRTGVFTRLPEPGDAREVIEVTQSVLAQMRTLRPDSELVFQSESNLADAYTVQDDDARGLEHYLRAIEVGERLQLRDARLANALAQAAAISTELGRPADGVAYARRGVALAEELGAEIELGSSLTMLGSALLDTGRRAEARKHLERALRLREKLREPGRFRGNTRFLLARAVWPADRKRARELAAAARVDIQADIDSLPPDGPYAAYIGKTQRARLAEIDAWLRAPR